MDQSMRMNGVEFTLGLPGQLGDLLRARQHLTVHLHSSV